MAAVAADSWGRLVLRCWPGQRGGVTKEAQEWEGAVGHHRLHVPLLMLPTTRIREGLRLQGWGTACLLADLLPRGFE